MKALLAAAAALILGACAAPQGVPGDQPRSGVLLVGNKGEDSLSFVDLGSGVELGRAATGRMPHEIAVSPDGRQAAVVAYGGASIDIFDIATRRRVRTIDLGANQGPHGLLWLADGRLVATTERSRTVTIVDTARGDAVSAVPTGQEGTHMVAVSGDGRIAFTANIAGGTVSVIDLAAGRKIRDLHVGGTPEGIALTPDGRTLWVADLEGARVMAFDAAAIAAADPRALTPSVRIPLTLRDGSREEVQRLLIAPLERELRGVAGVTGVSSEAAAGAGAVTVSFAPGTDLSAAAPQVRQALARAGARFPKGRTEAELRLFGTAPLATVATGPRPIRVAVSPDGRWVVTSDFGTGGLTVIDAASRVKARDIAVSGSDAAQQVTILFSADGRRLYAAETGRNQVAEIDFATGQVLRRLPAGKNGDGLAIAAPAAAGQERR
jgi:DNA-binding beta-propeller fold protein YncE